MNKICAKDMRNAVKKDKQLNIPIYPYFQKVTIYSNIMSD